MGHEINTETLELETALFRLLHHRAYRQAFVAGRYAELCLSEENLQHLMAIDRDDLEETARKIVRNLLRGDTTEGSGGLTCAFPRVLQMLQASGCDLLELMYEFTSSEAFDRYREIPFAGEGICVEEAFYHYLSDDSRFAEGSVVYDLLTHEFLQSLLAILVVNQDPSFVIETPLVRSNGVARYALHRMSKETAEWIGNRTITDSKNRTVIWLYAATKQRFVSGPISPFIADVLAFGSPEALLPVRADLMKKYSLTADAFQANVRKLGDMGLLSR